MSTLKFYYFNNVTVHFKSNKHELHFITLIMSQFTLNQVSMNYIWFTMDLRYEIIFKNSS